MAKMAYIGVPTSDTTLLLHGDTVTDDSGNNRAIANTGVTVSTDQSKFGGSSLYFNGSSYLTPSYVNDFALGSGDFTIDWWEYRTANGDSSAVYNRRINDTNPYSTLVGFSTNGDVQAYMAAADGAWTVSGLAMGTVQLNTWVHRALVRNGGTLSTYQNGVLIASTTVSGSLDTGTVPPDIGRWHYNASTLNYFVGYINDFRIRKSAVWTDAFTPPTEQATVTMTPRARKIKKGYIGIDGVARKIKKAYIGIGGVARPCWPSGELAYYGTITGLSDNKLYHAATTVGNYAVFGCGGVTISGGTTTYSNTVTDAYDTSLTRTNPTSFSVWRFNYAATTLGNYALFGGGSASSDGVKNAVEAYDTSLTLTTLPTLSISRYYLAATTVGGYALFGGGASQVSIHYATADAYDTSLTRSIPTALSVNRDRLAATTVGGYALFGGGYQQNNPGYATVDAYDTSLTRSIPTALSATRYHLAATTLGNYALFGGGNQGSSYLTRDTVDAYDKSLTRITITALSKARGKLSATTLGDYVLFGGGEPAGGTINTVDAYDTSLTRSIPTALSVARHSLAATTIGDYALFSGGYIGGDSYCTCTNTVDAYTLI